MNPPGRILLIEDDPGLSGGLISVLSAEGHQVTHAKRGDEGLRLGESGQFDCALTDLRLPGLGGLELIRQLHAARPRLPIVLMTAHGTTETAIEATKLGAYDYLLKPFEMEELIDVVAKAVVSGRQAAEVVVVGDSRPGRDSIVGRGRAMQAIYKELGRVAAQPVSVLIRGETGTGKELIARAIYQHSNRATAPLIVVNCAAIPETLLESELFGHERGAFTGAVERRIGRFEQANGGTLFLDEIGEMGASTQAKLLRVLQERVIQRVGGRDIIPVDVRIIAATHVDLEEAISSRQFREDLFYRLNQVTIALPPLRERIEDLPELAQHFMALHAGSLGISSPSLLPEALEVVRHHSWPGNVRELENVIRLALLRAGNYPITAELVEEAMAGLPSSGRDRKGLPEMIQQELTVAQAADTGDAYRRVVELVEKELFVQAMGLADGNQARAARWLGVSRVTLREKLRQHGLKSATEVDAA